METTLCKGLRGSVLGALLIVIGGCVADGMNVMTYGEPVVMVGSASYDGSAHASWRGVLSGSTHKSRVAMRISQGADAAGPILALRIQGVPCWATARLEGFSLGQAAARLQWRFDDKQCGVRLAAPLKLDMDLTPKSAMWTIVVPEGQKSPLNLGAMNGQVAIRGSMGIEAGQLQLLTSNPSAATQCAMVFPSSSRP